MAESARTAGRVPEDVWASFATRLAHAIGQMGVETFLVLGLPEDAAGVRGFVQFARSASEDGAHRLRAESVGSDHFAATRPLTPAQLARLRRIGWHLPRTSDHDCGNHWREWPDPAPASDIAAVAVTTLRDVYGVASPDELRTRHGSFEGEASADPGLGLAPIEGGRPDTHADDPIGALRATIEAGLRAWGGLTELEVDADGDYRVPVDGGARVCVRLIDGAPPVAAVFSTLAVDIPPSQSLFLAVNAINGRLRFGRVWWDAGRITVGTELSGHGLTADQVGHACLELAHMASLLDDDLHGRFGGRMAPGAGPTRLN